MDKFVRNFITEWRKLGLPFAGATAVVAVSGGADSAALLAALTELRDRKKLDLRLIAAHFDHGLRGRASVADRKFVEKMAAKLSVEFASGSAAVQKRGNLEQNARNARYTFLQKTAADAGSQLVLTGHTMNDQAETFLLNLIRGSGRDGLSAMKPVRQLCEIDAATLARPLLRWAKREETERFCTEMSIRFRLDKMNDDLAFNRVKVRKMLIPLLKDFNPKVIDTLCHTAERIGEVTPEASSILPEALPVAELSGLPPSEQLLAVRSWLAFRRGSLRGIDAKHLEAVRSLAVSRKSGRTVELPGRRTVSKQGGRLVFGPIMVEK